MLELHLRPLPDNLKNKITPLTHDELNELREQGVDMESMSLQNVMHESEENFRAAITLLEYKGVKKKTWRDLDSGTIMSFMAHMYNETFMPTDSTGNLRPLPEAFEGKDGGLTGGEKFDLHGEFGVMSLEQIGDIDKAFDFMVKARGLDVDMGALPVSAKATYIAHVTLGNFPVQKEFMMSLDITSTGN